MEMAFCLSNSPGIEKMEMAFFFFFFFVKHALNVSFFIWFGITSLFSCSKSCVIISIWHRMLRFAIWCSDYKKFLVLNATRHDRNLLSHHRKWAPSLFFPLFCSMLLCVDFIYLVDFFFLLTVNACLFTCLFIKTLKWMDCNEIVNHIKFHWICMFNGFLFHCGIDVMFKI